VLLLYMEKGGGVRGGFIGANGEARWWGSTWRGGRIGACAVRGCCRARVSEARGREVGDGRGDADAIVCGI
jgi:hypothetical protein